MVFDMGPIIYVTLTLYVVGGILCAVVLSLGAWGVARLVKRVQEHGSRQAGSRRRIGPFSHSPQHGRA